jgi:hypothetical protein
LWATVEARRWAWERQSELQMTAAWAAEALARTKRLPQLSEWLRPKKKQVRAKADVEQEFAAMKARMGGRDGG